MSAAVSYPSFYAVIPANVRYCQKLEPGARLLYGEITALASKEGYAWPTDEFLANCYQISKRTISRWLTSLHNLGFIEIVTKKCGIKWDRKIYIKEISTKSENVKMRDDKNGDITLQEKNNINKENTTKKKPPKEELVKTAEAVLPGCCQDSMNENSIKEEELPESVVYATFESDDKTFSVSAIDTNLLVSSLKRRSHSMAEIKQAISVYLKTLTPVRNIVGYLHGIIKNVTGKKDESNNYFRNQSGYSKRYTGFKTAASNGIFTEGCDG